MYHLCHPFVAAFNVILEYVGEGVERYTMSKGNRIELLRGFMDDVSILTTSVPMAKRALKRTEVAVSWARMKLKPVKSRSLVIQKGRSMDVEPFSVGSELEGGEVIPALQRKPLKTLGRWYDPQICDKWYRVELKEKLGDGLKRLNKSYARGAMKLWALHHILLQQIRWDLMVYEIPVSFVEKLEARVSVFIHRWLGVSRNMTNVALYAKKSVCPLPFSSLVNMFKTTKVNSHMQLVDSRHSEVVKNVIPSNTGRKWKLYNRRKIRGCKDLVVDTGVIRRCELRLVVDEHVGYLAQGRMGLDFAGGEEGSRRAILSKRQELVKKVVAESEEEYLTRAVQMGVQGRWTAWKELNQRVISWRSLVYGNPRLYRFCIGATFDTLSSPANLKRWGLESSDECFLCQKQKCTVRHVLSGCKVALAQGRYRYRHDSVLRVISHHLAGFINSINCSGKKVSVSRAVKLVRFVPEGVSPPARVRQASPKVGLLSGADDCVYLDKKLVFRPHIMTTLLRPDIVIFSNTSSTVVMVELTCPSEENVERQHEAKLLRYTDLRADCELRGWKVHLFAVEVGARGYTAQSLSSCLRALGLGSRPLRACLQEAGDEALRTSFWVWFWRDNDSWSRVGFANRKRKRKQPDAGEGTARDGTA